MWTYRGQRRPEFATEPGPDQESVWDYPRPPQLERTDERVRVLAGGVELVSSVEGYRLMETASPPTYYVPEADIDMTQLQAVGGQSLCEWKGRATYYALKAHPQVVVAWAYPDAHERYAALSHCLSFYPGRIDCFVDDERVAPQPGQFYGGWITQRIVGPFKGEPGTGHW